MENGTRNCTVEANYFGRVSGGLETYYPAIRVWDGGTPYAIPANNTIRYNTAYKYSSYPQVVQDEGANTTLREYLCHAPRGDHQQDPRGAAGNTTVLSASVSGGRSPFKYSWNFSDGTVANDTTAGVEHVYAAAGQYTVLLSVTDADGDSTSAGLLITVPEGSPAPASVQVWVVAVAAIVGAVAGIVVGVIIGGARKGKGGSPPQEIPGGTWTLVKVTPVLRPVRLCLVAVVLFGAFLGASHLTPPACPILAGCTS